MVIVIGTGAGGAIIAMELAKANIPVTILERGPYIESKDSFEYYDMKDHLYWRIHNSSCRKWSKNSRR